MPQAMPICSAKFPQLAQQLGLGVPLSKACGNSPSSAVPQQVPQGSLGELNADTTGIATPVSLQSLRVTLIFAVPPEKWYRF